LPNSVLAQLVARRLAHAALAVADEPRERLIVFVELLARWNRKVNLTAFDLDRPTAEAVDRLVVEPVRAAAHVQLTDREAVDVGSGGGSPAIPLSVCCPQLRMVMVESREKKGAFLREAVRTVGISGVVEVCRLEEFAERAGVAGRMDVISMRAVRSDVGVVSGIERLLAPGGVFLWFGGIGHSTQYNNLQLCRVDEGLAVMRRRVITG
jgi:16S rRNA (guanine527-N7)-methyltransferase